LKVLEESRRGPRTDALAIRVRDEVESGKRFGRQPACAEEWADLCLPGFAATAVIVNIERRFDARTLSVAIA
jgi:hypothetical protein